MNEYGPTLGKSCRGWGDGLTTKLNGMVRFQKLISLRLVWILGALAFVPGALFAADRVIAEGAGFDRICTELLARTTPADRYGPRFMIRPRSDNKAATAFTDIKRVKIVSYNMQDFGIDGFPAEKIAGLKRNILSENPDIVVGVEIASMEALRRLNKDLNGEYFQVFIPSNDPGDHHLAFLIHRRMGGLKIEIQSFRDWVSPGDRASLKTFTRDFPVLAFRAKNSPDDSPPLFLLAGVHLKSKFHDPSQEDRSALRRKKEMEAIVAILNSQYDRRYSRPIPAFIAGDFNFDLEMSDELNVLKSAGMEDVFNLAEVKKGNERITHTSFAPGGRIVHEHLDGIFANETAAREKLVVNARATEDLNRMQQPLARPQSHRERSQRASDHTPVSVVLNFEKIRALGSELPNESH
ncbi:MAG: hypothetical protein H7301_10275 [Cryobacterium sp.]|nr:hypothetical protein [Oligoflexia bacterium]